MWGTILGLISGQQNAADAQSAADARKIPDRNAAILAGRDRRQSLANQTGKRDGIDIQSLIDGVFTGKSDKGMNWSGGRNAYME